MLPQIQLGLAGKVVNSIDSLIAVGRQIEEAYFSAKEYHVPPLRPKNSIEPGLEYHRSIARTPERQRPPGFSTRQSV